MRDELERNVSEAEAIDGTAEAIPLADASVDAATAGQAYHWFEPERALPELHRVLRPGGGLALLWNSRDLDDPLQAAIEELLAPLRGAVARFEERDPRIDFEHSSLFTQLEERRFRNLQRVTTAGLLDADRIA
jgi:ubiquinone/menaquinone biosynthesis C-methylase UbiE